MPEPTVRERTTCRICTAPLLPILSLGSLYLSDFPHSAGTQAHPPVPLDLARCSRPRCGLVQLVHTTPQEWMYKQYWYRSGVNETMIAELRDVVNHACARVDLPPGSVVVDIGANDGTLLQQYEGRGLKALTTVAWEPAANLYEALRPHARVIFPESFHVEAPWPMASKARIVTAIAMFYDLDDPHAFLDGVARILAPEGVFVVQQAYLPAMLAQTAFDNIGHEHLEYYDLRALEALLGQHGLEVVDSELRRINGGSFRTTIQWKDRGRVHPRVTFRRAEEAALYAHGDQVFHDFAERAQAVRTQLRATLSAYVDQGGVIDLYAASTKANTLLQWCGIDARLIRQAWERSPEKIGRYVGVTGIPIVSEAQGRADPPDVLLVGGWQFATAFMEREAAFLAAGGKMIFPLPVVNTVEHRLRQAVASAQGDGAGL